MTSEGEAILYLMIVTSVILQHIYIYISITLLTISTVTKKFIQNLMWEKTQFKTLIWVEQRLLGNRCNLSRCWDCVLQPHFQKWLESRHHCGVFKMLFSSVLILFRCSLVLYRIHQQDCQMFSTGVLMFSCRTRFLFGPQGHMFQTSSVLYILWDVFHLDDLPYICLVSPYITCYLIVYRSYMMWDFFLFWSRNVQTYCCDFLSSRLKMFLFGLIYFLLYLYWCFF